MGNLEKEVKSKRRRENIQEAILTTIKLAGVLSVALVAPKLLKYIGKKSFVSKNQKYYFNKSLKRLLGNKLVVFKETEKGKFLELTLRGEKKLRQLEKYNFKIKKPKKWDGLWRIIIFDIKEKRRGIRDQMRIILRNIGFIRLQDSVWVYPYDCEDVMTLLKLDFQVGKDLLYIIAHRIENDRWLKEKFELK